MYGLQGKIKKTSAKAGMNSFAHGKVWDMEPGGQSCAIYGSSVSESLEFENNEAVVYQKIKIWINLRFNRFITAQENIHLRSTEKRLWR